MRTKPLAILGGTFDPVHIGHLRVALESAAALDAELRLIPASVPPHRTQPIATAAQRVAILQAALSGQDRLQMDPRELARSGPSYTIDTLLELRREIGPARALVLLLGRDAFSALPLWHRWRELLQHCHIGVLGRPGHSVSLSEELEREVASRWIAIEELDRHGAAGKVFQISVSALAISATAIRELLRRGGDVRYLLPDAVVSDPDLLKPYREVAATAARQTIPKS